MSFISYAQNFEDVRLWRAFADVGRGRYLDIGTQDPVQDSVSLAFYELGWRGVHVEPTPAYAAAMRAARPDEAVIEAAVSTAPGPLRFFEIPQTGLSTGKPEIAESHTQSGWEVREIVVPTVTLAGIFDIMGPDLIHWMKIDVEGMEEDVLRSWGDHPARPAALVIEATAPGTQRPTHQAWHELVTGKGYLEVLFDGLSRYFIHEAHAARGEPLALSPNIFDGYQVHQGHFAAHHLSDKHEAALAEAERHRIELEQQAESEAAALAASEAVANEFGQKLEAAELEISSLKHRIAEEVEAHTGTRERGQADAFEAAATLDKMRRELAALEAANAEMVQSQAVALTLARQDVAAKEGALAEATAQLKTLRQEHLRQIRENGVLDGRLAAQERAHAVRLADSAAARRQLSSQLGRAEKALERARAETALLQSEVLDQARKHEDALANLERFRAQATEALAQAHSERDSVRHSLTEAQHQLAGQVELNKVGAAARAELQAERDNLLEEIAAVLEQARAETFVFEEKLAHLQHQIRWREEQLRIATTLLDNMPEPLAGLPRIVAALVRPWISARTLASIADHRTDLDKFRSNLLLPPAPDLSHGVHVSLPDPTVVELASIEHRGAHNMEGDGPVTSVPRLLAPHDREFIRTAYQAVLGRAPDAEGEAYYLARLRAGTHKLAILKQLRRSTEGRAFIPGVAGLDRAIRRHEWAKVPVLGAVLRMLWSVQGDSAADRTLRIIVNEVGSIRSQLVTLHRQQFALAEAVRGLAMQPLEQPHVTTARLASHSVFTAEQDHDLSAPASSVTVPSPSLGQDASYVFHQLTMVMKNRHLKEGLDASRY